MSLQRLPCRPVDTLWFGMITTYQKGEKAALSIVPQLASPTPGRQHLGKCNDKETQLQVDQLQLDPLQVDQLQVDSWNASVGRAAFVGAPRRP